MNHGRQHVEWESNEMNINLKLQLWISTCVGQSSIRTCGELMWIVLRHNYAIHRIIFTIASCVAILLPEPICIVQKNAMAQSCAEFQCILHHLHRCWKCCAGTWIHLHQLLPRLDQFGSDSLWRFGHDDTGTRFGHFSCDRVLVEATHSNWFSGENLKSRRYFGISFKHWFAIRVKSSRIIMEIQRVVAVIHFDTNLFYCIGVHRWKWFAFSSFLARVHDTVFYLFAALPSNDYVRTTDTISLRSD